MKAPPISWIWAFSVLTAWLLVALDLDQAVWAQQSSQELQAYGAFKGEDLTWTGAWRLVASQWLHVKFLHMLLNILIIGTVGHGLQRRTSPAVVVLIGLGGGAVGQLASAAAHPDMFVSGASQAYLALCGAALLLLRPRSLAWRVAAVGTALAVGIDLLVSDHAAIKAGHLAGFVAGASAAAGLRIVSRSRSGPP